MEKFKIISEKENPLMNRQEVVFNLESGSSPKNSEVEKFISEKFSCSSEKIKVKGIHGNFGSNVFKITANIYKSEEDKENTERKSKKERDAQKAAAEKPAEETSVSQESVANVDESKNDNVKNSGDKQSSGSVDKDETNKSEIKEENVQEKSEKEEGAE